MRFVFRYLQTCVYWMEEIYVPQDEIYYVNSCYTQLGEMISQFAISSLLFKSLPVSPKPNSNFQQKFCQTKKKSRFLYSLGVFFRKNYRGLILVYEN